MKTGRKSGCLSITTEVITETFSSALFFLIRIHVFLPAASLFDRFPLPGPRILFDVVPLFFVFFFPPGQPETPRTMNLLPGMEDTSPADKGTVSDCEKRPKPSMIFPQRSGFGFLQSESKPEPSR